MSAGDGVLFDLMRDSLDHCVKCTICETFCPVSNATPLFPGPKYVGPQAERYRIDREFTPDASLDYCSGCGVCTQVCPQGVHIAEINTRARSKLKYDKGMPLRDRLIARPSVLGRLGSPVAPLANFTLTNRLVRLVMERTLQIDRKSPLPAFAGRTFQSWARKHRAPEAKRRVAYFHACGTNWYEPSLAQRTVAVLAHNGIGVEVPKQDCCGLPLQSNGLFDDARRYVRKLARRLAPFAREGTPIVSTNPSCALMLKREAREILDLEHDADLRDAGESTYDICEFLLDLHHEGELRTDFAPVPMTVAYHAPCQQQGHGVGKPALDLLALIPELRVVEMDATCCGMAGTYGIKTGKFEIGRDVGADLFGQVDAAAADVVVCDTDTCRWQIEDATGVKSIHPVEMLHRAYGLG